MLIPLIKTLRPYQWYKNLLLFVGLVFSHNLAVTEHFFPTLLGFSFFCLMAGAIYILNDVVDKEKDRLHPIKGKRPIASGELDVRIALIFMGALLAGCPLGAYFFIRPAFALILAIYFVLFVLYSYWLKYLVLIDAFVIGGGFVLRAIAGTIAVPNAEVSWWLIMCTLFLALFLAFGKRRAEMVEMGEKGAGKYRSVYNIYTPEMLNHIITITACSTVVVYCLYSAFSIHEGMVLTVPFVIFGVFKYLELMYSENLGAEPEKIFSNGYMVGTLILWGGAVLFVLYGKVDLVLDFIRFQ